MLPAMSMMRAVQVSRPGGPFELIEKPVPTLGPGAVLVKVEACGICHGDALVKEGHMPIQYPRVPGHEVAGIVAALGPVLPTGPSASGWASAGTGATAASVRLAGAESFLPA
jgi:D-arabinose 1-dehydrogenase-like Zn-dependent alcohol dehydrogenase